MAETVKLPGIKKPIPKTAVYVAGAGAVGIVGYAWFSKGRSDFAAQQAAIDDAIPGPVAEPTDDPGFDVIGGGGPPKTNADWNELAVTRLMNIGIDAIAAQAAIGKFLARRSLTAAEASLVEQAIAAAGFPPENQPWVIIRATVPGPVTPPPTTTKVPAAPRNMGVLPKAPGRVGIAWPKVTGATKYRYRWETASDRSGWGETTSDHKDVIWRFKKGTVFTAVVQAGNSAGWGGSVRGNQARAL
jgi:hypothetical protein